MFRGLLKLLTHICTLCSSTTAITYNTDNVKPATFTFEHFRFLAPCKRLRAIVCVLSARLRDDESSTCVCLRLREQCLRSEITPVSRVANVLLLRFVAGNMDVNTPASKRSQLIGNTAIVRKRCVIHKSRPVCASVFQLPRLRGNAGTQGSTCGRLK